MKAKQWASWLLAGIMALGQAPVAATAATVPAAPVTTAAATADVPPQAVVLKPATNTGEA